MQNLKRVQVSIRSLLVLTALISVVVFTWASLRTTINYGAVTMTSMPRLIVPDDFDAKELCLYTNSSDFRTKLISKYPEHKRLFTKWDSGLHGLNYEYSTDGDLLLCLNFPCYSYSHNTLTWTGFHSSLNAHNNLVINQNDELRQALLGEIYNRVDELSNGKFDAPEKSKIMSTTRSPNGT